MKKKLLFSLLLGSAFAWMNEMYAATEAAKADEPAADVKAENPREEGKPAAKAEAPKVEEEKEFEATDTKGNQIKVRFFDKSKHPGMVTKFLNLQDGEAYSNKRMNIPYMAGMPMPEGAEVVYVVRNKSNPDILKFVPAAGDPSSVDGFSNVQAEWWMYFDGKYVYPFKEIPDTNAETVLGRKASIYQYEVPDYEATAMAKKAADAEEKLAAGGGEGGASTEEITKLKADLEAETKKAADAEEKLKTAGESGASAEEVKKLQAELDAKTEELKTAQSNPSKEGGTGGGISPEQLTKLQTEITTLQNGLLQTVKDLKNLNLEGDKSPVPADPSVPLTATFAFKGIKFVVMSSDPGARKYPEFFKELVTNLEILFSKQPAVAAAVVRQMVRDNATSPEAPESLDKFAVADIYKLAENNGDIKIVADLIIATEITYPEAKASRDALLGEYGKVSQTGKETSEKTGELETTKTETNSANTVEPQPLTSSSGTVVDAETKSGGSAEGGTLSEETKVAEELTVENQQLLDELAIAKQQAEEAEKAAKEAEDRAKAAQEVAAKAIDVTDSTIIKEQDAAKILNQVQVNASEAISRAQTTINQSEAEKQAAEAEVTKLDAEKKIAEAKAAQELAAKQAIETQIATLTTEKNAAVEKANEEAEELKANAKELQGEKDQIKDLLANTQIEKAKVDATLAITQQTNQEHKAALVDADAKLEAANQKADVKLENANQMLADAHENTIIAHETALDAVQAVAQNTSNANQDKPGETPVVAEVAKTEPVVAEVKPGVTEPVVEVKPGETTVVTEVAKTEPVVEVKPSVTDKAAKKLAKQLAKQKLADATVTTLVPGEVIKPGVTEPAVAEVKPGETTVVTEVAKTEPVTEVKPVETPGVTEVAKTEPVTEVKPGETTVVTEVAKTEPVVEVKPSVTDKAAKKLAKQLAKQKLADATVTTLVPGETPGVTEVAKTEPVTEVKPVETPGVTEPVVAEVKPGVETPAPKSKALKQFSKKNRANRIGPDQKQLLEDIGSKTAASAA